MVGPTAVADRLTPLLAVMTLPLGILAFMFLGLEAAAAVFVVGWLLLVPASAVLFGPSNVEQLEHVAELQETAERLDSGGESGDDADPVAKLRDRYARGEIDEAELERRLEVLIETEDLDPTDKQAVERAIDSLDSERDDDEFETERA